MRIIIIVVGLCAVALSSPPRVMGEQNAVPNKATIQSHFDRAAKLLKAGHPQAAARQFLIVLHMDPHNSQAYANLGVIAYFSRDYAAASHRLKEALKYNPSLWNARALLGFSEEKLGHAQNAASQFEKAFPKVRDQRLRLQIGLQLAQIDYQAGNLERAVPILLTLQRLDPTNLEVLYASYRTFDDLAYHSLVALASVGIKSARMKQVVAESLVQEGDLRGAIAAYHAALKANPGLPGIHLELGEAYLESHLSSALNDAEREFKAELAQDPGDAKAECGLGDVYMRSGDLEKSLKHYEHAALLQPGSSEAHLGAGMVLLKMNRLHQAADELAKAVHLNPDSAVAHYQLSRVDLRLGKDKESQTEVAAFQRLNSFNDQLRNLYMKMGRPGEAKAAADLVPQSAATKK